MKLSNPLQNFSPGALHFRLLFFHPFVKAGLLVGQQTLSGLAVLSRQPQDSRLVLGEDEVVKPLAVFGSPVEVDLHPHCLCLKRQLAVLGDLGMSACSHFLPLLCPELLSFRLCLLGCLLQRLLLFGGSTPELVILLPELLERPEEGTKHPAVAALHVWRILDLGRSRPLCYASHRRRRLLAGRRNILHTVPCDVAVLSAVPPAAPLGILFLLLRCEVVRNDDRRGKPALRERLGPQVLQPVAPPWGTPALREVPKHRPGRRRAAALKASGLRQPSSGE
mmetsp:Transcript_34939/g.99062  ORF Transcript_34939/g.99062 Transcript_34939/m.99062 type:complete len:279 (+) Transcript_34939:551-1387(+)